MHYDLIVVLGSQPSTSTWELPEQIYQCLDHAARLLSEERAEMIAVCGKWSIDMDTKGLSQPFNECDRMAAYLADIGVNAHAVIKEGDSKDTISNLYYLKTKILIPKNLKRLVFVVARFRIPRIRFLCDRILGSEYSVSFEEIAAETGSSYDEPSTMQRQGQFLAPMEPGDHTWLDGKFYNDPFYTTPAPNIQS